MKTDIATVREHIEKIAGVSRTWFEWSLENSTWSKTLVVEVGALAVGRLEIRQARLRKVEIDDLTIRRLRVIDEPGRAVDPTATPTHL